MHKLPFCPVWQEDERLTVSTAGKDAGSVTHSWGMASVQLCHTRPGCRLCHRQPVHRLCHTQPGAGSVTQSQAQALSHTWPGRRLCHTRPGVVEPFWREASSYVSKLKHTSCSPELWFQELVINI